MGVADGGPAGEETIKESESLLAKDIAFCVQNDVDYIIHSVYEGR